MVVEIKLLDFKFSASILRDVAIEYSKPFILRKIYLPSFKKYQNDILISRFAALAQLVEQGTENPCVLGSIPRRGNSLFF